MTRRDYELEISTVEYAIKTENKTKNKKNQSGPDLRGLWAKYSASLGQMDQTTRVLFIEYNFYIARSV